MTSDPITDLCAVLLGERELPLGDDGDRLVALAQAHRVDRLLPNRDPHLNRRDALIDEVAVRELCAVVTALEEQGVAPLVFKGAALAHTHYAESWMRPRLDSDILIPPNQRERAFDVLRARGYHQPPRISGDLVSHQTMFVRADEIGDEQVFDVHWQIANPHVIAKTLTHRELIARATRVTVRGVTMRVPSPVDALLLASLHRAAHHDDADDLIWLYDIHVIATRFDAGQWTEFVDLAKARQVCAIAARGLTVTVQCFNTEMPSEIPERLSRAQQSREPSALFVRSDLRAIDRMASDLRTLGPREGVRLLREHLFPPSSYMRAKYHVQSRALLPAVYAYRIVAGAGKWIRGDHRGG